MRTHKNIIVTLQYNKFELTSRLIHGLVEHESENIDRIIAIDNGSEEDQWMKLLALSAHSPNFLDVYPRQKNEGFTLGANYGLLRAEDVDKSDGHLVFLISNDVQINGKFINQAEEILMGPKRALVGNRHINWDSGWNTFGLKTFDYLEGYFLATTDFGWFDLGYFDANYAPCDFEDVDLSTTAKKKGYKLVSLNNPNIVHAGAGTYGYNPEREAITKRNQKYFQQKWIPSG